MRIRPYAAGDETAVIELWEKCRLTRPWNDPRKDIARKLAVQPELFLVGVLGDALVAPVMAYVPEGDIDPPTSHMRFAGTITTPPDVFAKVLEYAARSFKQHGFLDIALIGDSGGNQPGQQLVAEALNKDWAATNVRVHHITAYYPGRGDDWVVSQGVSATDVGSHAGTHDTSSLMYLNPSMLRFDRMGPGKSGDGQGHIGNPAKATALFGQHILDMQVEDAVKQIQGLRVSSRR